MHATVTRVDTGDRPIADATMVAEEMMRWFREMEGFEGMLFLSRPGTTLAVTFWESAEIADKHLVSRMQFRDRMTATAGAEVEESQDYLVTFTHIGPWR